MMWLPPVRATDLERDETVEVLRSAFTAGCLSGGELVERAGRAYTAVTRDELHSLVGDLPRRPGAADADRPRDSRRVLGWEFSLMLAAAGAWLIATAVPGVTAVPLVLLWLVALRALGCLPRLAGPRDGNQPLKPPTGSR